MEDRTELAERLLVSLDETVPADPDHEAARAAVIDRRVQEIRGGHVELIEGSVTLARARAALAAAAARKR